MGYGLTTAIICGLITKTRRSGDELTIHISDRREACEPSYTIYADGHVADHAEEFCRPGRPATLICRTYPTEEGLAELHLIRPTVYIPPSKKKEIDEWAA